MVMSPRGYEGPGTLRNARERGPARPATDGTPAASGPAANGLRRKRRRGSLQRPGQVPRLAGPMPRAAETAEHLRQGFGDAAAPTGDELLNKASVLRVPQAPQAPATVACRGGPDQRGCSEGAGGLLRGSRS